MGSRDRRGFVLSSRLSFLLLGRSSILIRLPASRQALARCELVASSRSDHALTGCVDGLPCRRHVDDRRAWGSLSYIVVVAKVHLPSGQLQPPLVDNEVRHAALDAAMPGLAADEYLAVGRQQRRLRQNLHWRVRVDLDRAGLPPPGRSDVMEDPVVHSLLRNYIDA